MSRGGVPARRLIYVSGRVITPIYLADAALEAVLIARWAAALARRGERPA